MQSTPSSPSLIAIWLYVGFRFKFIYGVGAVVALFHDVLVTLGMVSIFDGVFNLEISQNMIAAFLTLVGLSVNDTVVIFDRIRENQKIFRSMRSARADQQEPERDPEPYDHHLRHDLHRADRAAALRRRGDPRVLVRSDHRHHHRYVFIDLHRQRDRPRVGHADQEGRKLID